MDQKKQDHDILFCQTAEWAPLFPQNAIPYCVIPLPPEILAFLRQDGVVLPGETGSEDSGSEDAKSFPSNIQFEQKVKTAITDLKGTVFPKLNWSAPQDATWSVPLLKCCSFSEIFLALQCSSLVHYDLEMLLQQKEIQPHLVLKQWTELPEGSEFRCFVSNNKLIAISQRDCSLYFPSISRPAISAKLSSFFKEIISPAVPLSKYVVDVSITKTKVLILDINLWGTATNSLLFTWEELGSADSLEFRIVESPNTVKAKSFDQFRAPVEFQAPNLAESVPQFLQEMKKSYK